MSRSPRGPQQLTGVDQPCQILPAALKAIPNRCVPDFGRSWACQGSPWGNANLTTGVQDRVSARGNAGQSFGSNPELYFSTTKSFIPLCGQQHLLVTQHTLPGLFSLSRSENLTSVLTHEAKQQVQHKKDHDRCNRKTQKKNAFLWGNMCKHRSI